MTDYTYSRVAALNFTTTPVTVGRSATGSVYAVGDTTFTTPLNVTMVVGGATGTSISSDANGFFPDFTVANRTSIVFKQAGTSFTSVLVTTDPVPGEKGDPGTPGTNGAKGDRGDLATWQDATFYPLNQVIANPVGDLVKVTTAHTSSGSYDATKFDYVVPPSLTPAAIGVTIDDKLDATVPPMVDAAVNSEVNAVVPPAVVAAIAADGTVTAAAAAAAGPAVDAELDTSDRIPKAGRASVLNVRDINGQVAFGVDGTGKTLIGPTSHKASPGWRVTDSTGNVALEVDENGRTHIYDPAFATGGDVPVTNVHVISGIGQSNMSGFGRPIGTGYEYNAPDPRVFQYGANTGVTSGITAETVPLDFNGTPNGLSPLTVIGREFLEKLPASHVVLLVPAAKGSTGLANTAASQGCWKIDYAGPNPQLWPMYLTQLDAAKAAAALEWPTATITHDATFWVQGEGDAAETRAAYEAALDALIAAERTHVADANHRFIIGGMVPDYMVGLAGNQAIRLAHVDTPRRVIRAAYADGIPNAANYGEEIHYAREGTIRLGKAMLDSLDRATANLTTVSPVMPRNVRATAAGGTLTIAWDPPMSRVTAYVAEYKVDAGSWTAITGTEPLETTVSVTGLSGTTVQVRVSTTNEVGTSTPSIPVTIGL